MNNEWHLAYVPVNLAQSPVSTKYWEMAFWCTDNIGEQNKLWKHDGDMQVSGYWVFGFKNKEDAVQFTMVFS